ncbi:DUF2285 domain-containing protein [Phyllobacterium leguminum]|uniref:DUF2285 domain-containing protein n=1 Tax=Phyllobacterium leguminum TaxID=314237 RepID=UPI000DA20580|nr:DUF2285 domain-containing protein [Phyllobacterium leguminum]
MPHEDTSAIVITAAPAYLNSTIRSPRNLDFQPRGDGSEASGDLFYDLGNGERLQLLPYDIQADNDAPLVALVPLGLDGFGRLESVGRFLSAIHGRAIPPDTRLTAQQKARARRMLQAFDGRRSGATQQEIAQIIFRTGRLGRDEWQASSARHAVMSLLRDAKSMVSGDYRKLLRHRRRT